MLKYPINQKNFNALRLANEAKASDMEFSTDGFKELLVENALNDFVKSQ